MTPRLEAAIEAVFLDAVVTALADTKAKHAGSTKEAFHAYYIETPAHKLTLALEQMYPDTIARIRDESREA